MQGMQKDEVEEHNFSKTNANVDRTTDRAQSLLGCHRELYRWQRQRETSEEAELR